MKKTTKVVLSAILTIAMCLSVIGGATFALFTSEAKTDISVTSGTVLVDAEIVDLATSSMGVAQAPGKFANNGTAVYDEQTGVLTLTNITPGDKVTFNMVVTNNSNVTIQYRVRWIIDGELAEQLAITTTGDATVQSGYSDWTVWDIPTDATKTKTIPLSVALPAEVGDLYQNKNASITFVVEAVQGNATIYNGVAKIGEQAYPSIQEAVDAAAEGDVVEIINPGQYAPFTIGTKNVTVKGIMGDSKVNSTVIQVTGDNMVKLYADGAAIDNMYIDVIAGGSSWTAAAIDTYIAWNAGTVADNVSITNCYIDGKDNVGMAILYCGNTITLTNNTFVNFPVAVSSMCDNSVATSYNISNNTTTNVDVLIDGYWGATYAGATANLTINNNTATDQTLIRLWDYATTGTAVNAEVKGNTNATLMLTDAADAVVDTDEAGIFYQYTAAVSGLADGTYTVQGANAYNDSTSINVNNGNASVRLTPGEYKLVGADNTYALTMSEDGVATTLRVIEVRTAEELAAALAAGGRVELMNDINMENVAWTPAYVANALDFEGNDHVITNLSVDAPISTGFECYGLIGYATASVTMKNLTIDNMTVTGQAQQDSHVGAAFVAVLGNYSASNHTYLFENCTVKNSAIGSCDYAGGFFGYTIDNADITIKNCTVENNDYLNNKGACGAVAGMVQGKATLTVEGGSVIRNDVECYRDGNRAGMVVGTSNATTVVTLNNVTANTNTATNGATATNNVVGRVVGSSKLYIDTVDVTSQYPHE